MDTKELRQKILDLAIHGKLVPQDPNDEPASVLLERIRAEKEHLIKEGKIKRSKKSASDTPHYENRQVGEANEVPFEVPESWEWLHVESFTYDLQYGTSEKSSNEGDVPVLRMGNITRIGTIDFADLVYSSNKDDISKYALQKDDLLFNRTNSSEWVGKTAIFKSDSPAIYAGYLIRVRCILVCPDYINFVLNSSYHRDWCNSVKTDAVNQSNINAQKLSKHLIPIPPYEEQLRIVVETKIWMNVIDKLEGDVSEFEQVISKIKSKILDLAIHGKLVPQDPNDEPAIELLKRINPKFTPCDNAHCPYDIPGNWYWCKLIDLCSFLSRGKSPTYSEERKYPVFAQKCNLYGGGISLDQARFLDPNTLSKWPEDYKLLDGDVLVNSTGTGTVGRTRLFHSDCLGSYPFVVPDSHVSVIRTVGNIDSNYIYSIFSSRYGQEYIEDNLAGSTNQKELYIGVLENMLIPLPPYDEQRRIASKLKESFAILEAIQDSIEA